MASNPFDDKSTWNSSQNAWDAPNDWGDTSPQPAKVDEKPNARVARQAARGRTNDTATTSGSSSSSAAPAYSSASSSSRRDSDRAGEQPPMPSITTRAAAVVSRSRGREGRPQDAAYRNELLEGANTTGSTDAGWGDAGSFRQQQLQEAKKDTRSNKEILQDSIRTASQATVVGAQTINKLDHQTDQMHAIDRNLSEINATLTASERLIKGMKSFTGAVGNWFSKGPKHKPDNYTGPKDDLPDPKAGKVSSKEKEKVPEKKQARKGKGAAEVPEEPQEQLVEHNFQDHSYEDEDQMLDQLYGAVSTMKGQAHTMNTQLKYQGGLLDHIGDKVERTDGRILKNTADIRRPTGVVSA